MQKTPEQRRLARSELVRRIQSLAPKARLGALIDAADAQAMVRAVPAEDLYAAIVDVGLADAAEVVQLTTPQQFRTFVDLAGWRRDKLDPREVVAWLLAARGEDSEAFAAKLRGLDVELLELIFSRLAVLHDLEENPDVSPTGPTIETAEGKYLVELLGDEREALGLRALVSDLIASNPFEASRFLEAVRWALPSEVEEVAYQFRQARLEDLGFPPLEEAMALFAYLNPRELAHDGGSGKSATNGAIDRTPRVDYVEAAFRGLDSEERQGLQDEVRYLVNSALVAEGADPGDPPQIRRVSEFARDMLSLGLEHLTGGDAMKAADCVRERHLKGVFQVGFSLTLELKFRADRLARVPRAKVSDKWLLFDAELKAVEALRQKRPLRVLKVEGAEPVPYRTRRELAEGEAVLARAEAQQRILAGLLASDAARTGNAEAGAAVVGQVGAETAFALALGWAVLDGLAALRPLPAGRLVELCERLVEADPAGGPYVLRQTARARAEAAVTGLAEAGDLPVLSEMVQLSLARLGDELGATYVATGSLGEPLVTTLPVDMPPALGDAAQG